MRVKKSVANKSGKRKASTKTKKKTTNKSSSASTSKRNKNLDKKIQQVFKQQVKNGKKKKAQNKSTLGSDALNAASKVGSAIYNNKGVQRIGNAGANISENLATENAIDRIDNNTTLKGVGELNREGRKYRKGSRQLKRSKLIDEFYGDDSEDDDDDSEDYDSDDYDGDDEYWEYY